MSSDAKTSLVAWITAWLRTELKLADAPVATDATFVRFGMDSVHAMMMIGDLEEHLDRRLSPTLAWDHPTIDALASHLAGSTVTVAPAAAAAPADVLARIDTMSEAELDRLLEREQRGQR